MTIRIQPHPASPEHQIAIVTTSKGYVYACTYAPMDEPLTEEVVERDFRKSRKSFHPYDETQGSYSACHASAY